VRNIRDAGYCTAVIGKTHLRAYLPNDGHTRDHEAGLNDWGFEYTHEVKDTVPSPTHRCYYSDFLAERKTLQVFEDYSRNYRRGEAMKTIRPWEQTPNLLQDDEHIDIYTANTAAEWIQNYEDNRPFYLQVSFMGPHPPFDAPVEYRDMFEPENMPLPIMDPPVEPISPQVKSWLERRKLQNMTEYQSQMMVSHYYAKVAFDDYGVGIVLDALKKRGLMDNIWIIYTSDHGEMLGDHRLCQKAVFYEGALNIPLIVRPPGGTSSWTSNGLTDLHDISATMHDVACASPFENGISLIPKIEAGPDAPDAQKGKDVVFSEVDLYSMARTEQYKMTIDSVTRKPVELYDMIDDPRELRNLVDEPSLKEVREQFMNDHFHHLLSNMNEAKLKAFQDGGNPGSPHAQYPEY